MRTLLVRSGHADARGLPCAVSDDEMAANLEEAQLHRFVQQLRHITSHVNGSVADGTEPAWSLYHRYGPNPVEDPHNAVHLSGGWPLSDFKESAFHPLFYLLHAEHDRMYESWLA